MDYITAKQFDEKWHISQPRVQVLYAQGFSHTEFTCWLKVILITQAMRFSNVLTRMNGCKKTHRTYKKTEVQHGI
jgi:phage terminase large subunit-like protein